jgi:hypothetical protein
MAAICVSKTGAGVAPDQAGEYLEVLPGGVEHFHAAGVGQAASSRGLRSMPGASGSTSTSIIGVRHLDQADLRPVGGFAVEFGVDSEKIALGQLSQAATSACRIGDQPDLAGLVVVQNRTRLPNRRSADIDKLRRRHALVRPIYQAKSPVFGGKSRSFAPMHAYRTHNCGQLRAE